MQEIIKNVNYIIKKFFAEEKLSLEQLKSLKNSVCEELSYISYHLKKDEDSYLDNDLDKIKKLYKLIERAKIDIIEYYALLVKEYEFKEGKISKTLKKYSQSLYLLNLIKNNEEIDFYSSTESQINDNCLAGSLKNFFNRQCYVFGTENDVEKKFTGKQGNNVFGMQNDCGIACVTQILILSGKKVTENDVVRVAISEGLCNLMEHSMRENGATSALHRAALLNKFNVKSKIEELNQKQLAYYIEHGFGIIVSVDSGILWNRENDLGIGHAIVLYGTIHDANDGKLLGFIACDTGSGNMKRIISCEEYAKMSNFDRGINITLSAIRS